MPRLFLGLALPEPVKDRLLTWKADIDGARWQSRQQLHLTLCFLGEVAPPQVPAVFRALDGLDSPSFFLEPVGTGCFGNPEAPRNLWAGVQPAAPVTAVHDELCRRLAGAGFAIEARRFHPHITLARFSRRGGGPARDFLERFRGQTAPVFPVDVVSLFLSQPGPEGSRYHRLADIRLKDV